MLHVCIYSFVKLNTTDFNSLIAISVHCLIKLLTFQRHDHAYKPHHNKMGYSTAGIVNYCAVE